MALSDEELLDFDASEYGDYDEERVRQALAEHGDVFRAQLVAARWIEGWRRRLKEGQPSFTSKEAEEAYLNALGEVEAHLRQANLVPGGLLYDDTVNGNI